MISFGTWDRAAGACFCRERIWWKGYKWTPFVRISRRYKESRRAVVLCGLLGWHNGKLNKWSDGCSARATCSRCGKEVMRDSQGNWFVVTNRDKPENWGHHD